MKEKNKPIGEVECAHTGCGLKMQVFKYRQRAKEAWAVRHAGKWYAVCEKKHRCEDQDYLAEKSHIWSKEELEKRNVAPVQSAEKTASAPVQPSTGAPNKVPAKTTLAPVVTSRLAPPISSQETQESQRRPWWNWTLFD